MQFPLPSANQTKQALFVTRVIFFICGICYGSWAMMVPYVKERLGLDEAQLGILLLSLGVGAIMLMPIGGRLSRTIGNKRAVTYSSIITLITLPTLMYWPNPWTMASGLFVLGATLGIMDVTMNAHGILVEKEHKKPIMSSLHGMFSVGGLVGPIVFSGLLKLDFSPETTVIVIASCAILALIWGTAQMFTFNIESAISAQLATENQPTNVSVWKSASVLILGYMCFAVFLSEGSMLDWSAVYLRDERGLSAEDAGWGFVAFSIAMAVMRLSGDYIIARFNEAIVVLGGALIGGTGIFLLVFANWLPLSLIGFMLLGVGAANIVPVLFSAAGKIPGIPVGVALPAISMLGYTGQLAGPALIGIIAHQFTLSIALLFCGMLMFSIGIAYQVYRKQLL